MAEPSVFLTAQWRHLAMLTYEVPPSVLRPYIPPGTELDTWDGKAFVTVVGFLFDQVRLLGWAIPGHQEFVEVNLRGYVRRRGPDGWRRGVVFVRELVPLMTLAVAARLAYHERYLALPMWHQQLPGSRTSDSSDTLEYAWRFRGRWNHLWVRTRGELSEPAPGSLEAFIVEHHWGYARIGRRSCLEYHVEHPPWRVQPVMSCSLDCDVSGLYGAAFGELLTRAPSGVLVAEGSAVVVRRGVRIRTPAHSNGH